MAEYRSESRFTTALATLCRFPAWFRSQFSCIPTNPTPLSAYLSYARRELRHHGEVYKKLRAHLLGHTSVPLDPTAIQYACNILNDFSSTLLVEYAKLFPTQDTFTLSEEYESTHLILIFREGVVKYRRASFGLVDVNSVGEEPCNADKYILRLLRMVLCDREREEVIMTLQGGDAERCLFVMQKLLDSAEAWNNFSNTDPIQYMGVYGDAHYCRVHRLWIKLAAATDKVPVPLALTGIVMNSWQPIAEGYHADVYRGCKGAELVALKRVRAFGSLAPAERRDMSEALFEIALTLKRLRHPRILSFLGVDRQVFSVSDADTCIVTPWMDNGNIHQYVRFLQKRHEDIPLARWLPQIVEGLIYLHSQGVMHGDLRGANVLISANSSVLLTDFGLWDVLAMIPSGNHPLFLLADETRWLAPELLDPISFHPENGSRTSFRAAGPTPASDIYSFACTCVEIYLGSDPQFEGIEGRGRKTDRKIAEAVLAGKRPIRPASNAASGLPISDTLWSIIERCWSQFPDRRPDAQTLLDLLTKF